MEWLEKLAPWFAAAALLAGTVYAAIRRSRDTRTTSRTELKSAEMEAQSEFVKHLMDQVQKLTGDLEHAREKLDEVRCEYALCQRELSASSIALLEMGHHKETLEKKARTLESRLELHEEKMRTDA